MEKSQFQNPWFPYLLLLPQMGIIAVFFLWPAAEAIRSSFFLEDPFFGKATYVGLDNYRDALSASDYKRTAWYTAAVMPATSRAVFPCSLGYASMSTPH